jgi:hypothetical protein
MVCTHSSSSHPSIQSHFICPSTVVLSLDFQFMICSPVVHPLEAVS